MEHLKLFAKRLNIPRLIRVCEEQHQWKELTYLYMQYDEYDNAANTMIAHSPVAWDHITFKDVVVKVSNVDVYYKGVRFYLKVSAVGRLFNLNVAISRAAQVKPVVGRCAANPYLRELKGPSV